MNAKTLSCEICGATQTKAKKPFTQAGLNLHKRSCKPTQPVEEEDMCPCPYCSNEYPESQIDAHMEKCLEESDKEDTKSEQSVIDESDSESVVNKSDSESDSESDGESVVVVEQPILIVEEPIVEEPVKKAVDQPVVAAVFEQINDIIEDEEEEEHNPTTSAVFNEVEDEVEFTLSEQSEIDTRSHINCNQCLQAIDDIGNARIICHACRIGAPTNVKDVETDINVVEQIENDQAVADFRPILKSGRLLAHAPTQNDAKRFVKIDKVKFQGLTDKVEIETEIYRATVSDLKNRLEEKQGFHDRRSIFHGQNLYIEQIKQLYQQNPQVSESKAFAMKLLLDNPALKFDAQGKIIVYLDTETSTCDGKYLDLPLPSSADHRLTIIQFLVDTCDDLKPTQFIFHMQGYTFDEDKLRRQFPDVDIIFKAFPTERQMVDSFWNWILAQKKIVIMTGFNACHKILQREGDQFSTPKEFLGYDMAWLTARSSYRFTPKNTQLKIRATMQTAYSCIQEIPNLYMVDYQAVMIKNLDQKTENNLAGYGLKDLLYAFGMIDNVAPILKIDQSIYDLQRKTHQQMSSNNSPTEDMTPEMAYSINDTVCLWRCEKMRSTMADMLFTPMAFANIGLSQATSFTSNALNILEIGRMKIAMGLPYRCVPVNHDEGKMTGAFTHNEELFQGKTTFHITQDDYSSLYPSVIIDRHIDADNLVGIVADPQPYSLSEFSVIEVSDDRKFKKLENRSFAVFRKTTNAILPAISKTLLRKRQEYKDLTAANKKDNKILAKKYDQLQLIVKVQANALFGGMSSPANPYFDYIIGAAITAGARECLQMANMTIHQTLGFQGGVALQE